MNTKTCTKCKCTKLTSEFHRESRNSDKLQRWCKKCANDYKTMQWRTREEYREKSRLTKKLYYQNHREEHIRRCRNTEMKRKYGIDISAYDKLLASQGGVCGLCQTKEPKGQGGWHVDHCHETGVVRGLLCHSCNTFLGIYMKMQNRFGAKKLREWMRRNPLAEEAGKVVHLYAGGHQRKGRA